MGAVNTTYTFEATDTITSAKMNNIIDQTTVTSDAIFGTTLEVASGKLKVRSQGITSNELATNAVTTTTIVNNSITTDKITDGVVTPEKLSNSDFGDFSVVSGVATIDNNVVTPAKLSQPLTSAIVQNSTSGTSIDFTSIPSWAKRITVMFSGVSTSGTSNLLVQLGDSGGIESTAYTSQCQYIGIFGATSTIGFVITASTPAADTLRGLVTICLVSSSTNSWVASSSLAGSTGGNIIVGAGGKALSSTLDRIRITTTNGTDTFDAGSINIMYE